ncbi:MAG: hypothetical protein Q4D74_01825 [Comamonadaceae bacterium]|nr:hypothetical protein [Comamonadaceae bacterium]
MRACLSVFFSRLRPRAVLLWAALMAATATAATDLPGRVARLSWHEGAAPTLIGDRGLGTPLGTHYPLTSGARVATQAGTRAELHSGSTALRLSGPSDLGVTELTDDTTRLALTQGTLAAHIRQLHAGERFEIGTPNLALLAQQPGEYRVDVDTRTGTTRVTVHRGSALLYGEGGASLSLGERQQATFSGNQLHMSAQTRVYAGDAFDQWAAARQAQQDSAKSARYVSREIPGYHQLDAHGDWAQHATYGAIWYPRITVSQWAPYRYGHWAWVEPWGWTWMDDAPWGFAPFHYGRWVLLDTRWAWVPGPLLPRPAYAPALVGFISGQAGRTRWSIAIGGGAYGTAWFPLAPGDYWEPFYDASPYYLDRVNPWGRRPGHAPAYVNRPGAISVAPERPLSPAPGRQPRFIGGHRLPPGTFDGVRPIFTPPPADVLPAPPDRTHDRTHVLRPQPDAWGMNDIRDTRTGADRAWGPAVTHPRPPAGADRPRVAPIRSHTPDNGQRLQPLPRHPAPPPVREPGAGELNRFHRQPPAPPYMHQPTPHAPQAPRNPRPWQIQPSGQAPASPPAPAWQAPMIRDDRAPIRHVQPAATPPARFERFQNTQEPAAPDNGMPFQLK